MCSSVYTCLIDNMEGIKDVEDKDNCVQELGEDRRRDFYLKSGGTYLNHGYKGAVPKSVIASQKRYLDQEQLQPSEFFRRKKFNLWKKSRDVAAEFVNADHDNVVLVQNVTTAVSTILTSLPFKKGNIILATTHTFAAVRNACRFVASKIPDAEAHFLEIGYPIRSEEDIVELYKQYMDTHPKIKVSVIDYITCCSAMKLPVAALVQLCRERNIISIVDGAHSPGQISLDLSSLGCDYFTGNFHKWMFTPWGCAFIWVNHDTVLKPLATSSLDGTDMLHEFYMQGTRDESAFYALPEAISYFNQLGGMERITEYNTSLIKKASAYLTSLWKTEILQIPSSMEAPFMRMVKLPNMSEYGITDDDANKLMSKMHDRFDIDVAIKKLNGSLYARLSAQIYNVLDDYKKLGDAILILKDSCPSNF